MKIDTKGNEYYVSEGGSYIVENFVKVIIIEVSDLPFYKGQEPFYKLIEYLLNKDFFLYSIFDNTRLKNGQLLESNFIFVKND